MRKKIVANEFIQKGSELYNGEPGKYEMFVEAVNKKTQESGAGHIVQDGYYVQQEPRAEIQALSDHQNGWIQLRFEDQKYCNQIVKDYYKQENYIMEKVEILKGIIAAMATENVTRHLEEVYIRRDLSPIQKYQMIRMNMDRRYRLFNDSSIMDIMHEMESLGWCQDDEDVLYLLDALTKHKQRIVLLERQARHGQINAVSDFNMKMMLIKRMPGADYQQIREALDVDGVHNLSTWDTIKEFVERKIRTRIKPMEEEYKEQMAANARANAAVTTGAEKPQAKGNFTSKAPCYKWRDEGGCPFGEGCRFSHEGARGRGYKKEGGEERTMERSRSRSPGRAKSPKGAGAGGPRSHVTFDKKKKPSQEAINKAYAVLVAAEGSGASGSDTED